MRCPYCSTDDDRVVDSRAADDGAAIRRRRECRACGQRFSTFERTEHPALSVRKRGGAVEPFDREKIAAGMAKATKNLAVDGAAVRNAIARVEARLRTPARREVASETVGEEVLEALRELDPVAAVRFASVYKGFTSPDDFARELAAMRARGDAGGRDGGQAQQEAAAGGEATPRDGGQAQQEPQAPEYP